MRVLLTLSFVLTVACGGEAPSEPVAASNEPYVMSDADAAILAKADAHDGTVDHVVSECAVCGLGMEGDPAQAVTVGDYEVHMCSETCKGHFEENTAGTVERLGEILN